MISINSRFLGYFSALGAAACYGLVPVLGKLIISDEVPALVVSALSMFIGASVLSTIFHRHVWNDRNLFGMNGLVFCVLAGVAATWGGTAFYLAITHSPVVQVSPLIALHPLVAIIFTHIFLQKMEKVTKRVVFGATLVVGGVVVIVVQNLI